MTNFDNYTFRCSALGKIISKSGKLTEGVKTYLQESFIEAQYGVKREAYGRALEKGKMCEEQGITMLNDTLFKGKLLVKNTERKRNDFIHGETDVYKDKTVFDIKNAFDLFTFGKAELTHDYEWQIKGYAWLWNTNKAALYYCLNNMPDAMLVEEERLLFYKNKWAFTTFEDPAYIEACEDLRKAHNYDSMPIYERFKVWNIEVTDEDIERIKEAVIAARSYLNELQVQHDEQIKANMKAMGLVYTAQYDNEIEAMIIGE